MPISNVTNGESGSDTRTSLNQVIDKVNGIEADADVTDAGNVGPAIGGATVITTLGDTDQIPVVQSNVLKSLAYSALKTLLGALYQAKATILGTLGGLSNAAGVLTNDGAGNLSWASGGGGIGGSTGSTDRAIPVANGTGGATLQGSGVTIDSSNNARTPGSLYFENQNKFLFWKDATSADCLILGQSSDGNTYISSSAAQAAHINLYPDGTATPGLSVRSTTGATWLYGVLRLKGYTVGTLPTATAAAGDTAFVTDALTPVSLATVVGGGSVVVKVFYDGTNWIVQ